MSRQRESPREQTAGGNSNGLDERSSTILMREADPVNRDLAPSRDHITVRLYATSQARCPQCSHRWPWPDGAPTPAESLLVRPSVACPSCHAIVPLETEPCDESWWAFVSTPPSAKPMKARSLSLVPRGHVRPNGDKPPRQFGGIEL